jgi:hypothetical protein
LPTVAMPEQAVLLKVSSGKQEQQAIQRNMLNHRKCSKEMLIKTTDIATRQIRTQGNTPRVRGQSEATASGTLRCG